MKENTNSIWKNNEKITDIIKHNWYTCIKGKKTSSIFYNKAYINYNVLQNVIHKMVSQNMTCTLHMVKLVSSVIYSLKDKTYKTSVL